MTQKKIWNTHMCGMVVLKISSIQLHVLSQVSGLNFSPLRMTTFSRQLVPDLANCSLSVRRDEQVKLWPEVIIYTNFSELSKHESSSFQYFAQCTVFCKCTAIVSCLLLVLYTDLAAHTSRAERGYHLTEHHSEIQSTAWKRHR